MPIQSAAQAARQRQRQRHRRRQHPKLKSSTEYYTACPACNLRHPERPGPRTAQGVCPEVPSRLGQAPPRRRPAANAGDVPRIPGIREVASASGVPKGSHPSWPPEGQGGMTTPCREIRGPEGLPGDKLWPEGRQLATGPYIPSRGCPYHRGDQPPLISSPSRAGRSPLSSTGGGTTLL